MSDVCIGTSIGTNTEPDCLGPCQPGTSVALEGIVWHETDGGVLVVNITWRGKTYVGTLLDSTRHDWAPPRFCGSPSSDLDIRTSKGRVKRGRTPANIVSCNDLLNFTETRSSMHSKLRNTGSKTRRGTHGSMAIGSCSAPFISPRSDSTMKRKTRCIDEDEKNKRKVPTTLLNISRATSPVLLECSKPNCFKKYKHINGLKYHQSHAHGLIGEDDVKENITSASENDESNIDTPRPLTPIKSPTESIGSNSNTLRNTSTISSEHFVDESPLAVQLTLPNLQVQPVKLPHNNVIDQRDTQCKNKECLEKNLVSISFQYSPTEPQCDSDSTKNVSSNSLNLKKSSPLNSNLSQQYEISNTAVSSQKLQKDQKNILLRSDNVLPTRQLGCQDVLSIDLLFQQEQNLIKGEEYKEELVYSENQSIKCHDKDQQSNHLEGVLSNHNNNSFKILSEQTLCEAKDINELTNTFLANPEQLKSIQTNLQPFADISINTKIFQFKVKPTADLMPEDDKNKDSKIYKNITYKKKTRKSPNNSPQRSNVETNVDADREDLQSPAYSDISDDAISSDVVNIREKLVNEHGIDIKSSAQSNLTPHFSMFPYFSPSPYLRKSSPEKIIKESKIDEAAIKSDSKLLNSIPFTSPVTLQNRDMHKDKKDIQSVLLSSQLQAHYYANYNSYLSAEYSFQNQNGGCQSLNLFSDSEFFDQKNKMKQESELQNLKDKHIGNQILKESIEIKGQINPYQIYQNSHSQRPSSTVSTSSDERRYYIYTDDQRRKDESQTQIPPKSLSLSPREHLRQDKIQQISKSEENKIRPEGVKPTMETHGPPPPPTSQYAYIHPGYITSHHYGGMAYESGNHGIYRNLTPILMSGTYTSNPYLQQLPRYTPEDHSRLLNGKTIDILHHSNQYYPSHKIHELQERAIKSPITRSPTALTSTFPSAQSTSMKSPNDLSNNTSLASTVVPPSPSFNIKQERGNNSHQQQQQILVTKDSNINSLNKGGNRSPPPQRHVHTHHHTHVGLGYPILPAQYPAPYGAAVLTSHHAGAVASTVISPFPTK